VASKKEHWESAYRGRPAEVLGWYQAEPTLSLDLIRTHVQDRTHPILDVGGGASTLVGHLLTAGFSDITVLDISEPALDLARTRLGDRADEVAWIRADVTDFKPARQWQAWHDRAVFHFLTERAERGHYVDALRAGLASGGRAIMATFSLEGPDRCSGLPVVRYSPETLTAELGAGFRILESRSEIHHTPGGGEQAYQYSVFERTGP